MNPYPLFVQASLNMEAAMNRHQRAAIRRKKEAHLGQPETYGYVMKESAIAGQIVSELRRLSYHVSSTQQTRPSRQTEGMPDLFVAHPAWRIYAWMEVKRPGETVPKHQREWHESVRASGCPVLVVTGPFDAVEQLNALRTT